MLAAAIPLFGGVLGLLQARRGVCVGYAVAGRQNLEGSPGEAAPVDDPDALREHRRAAWRLVAIAAAVAVVIAAVAYAAVLVVAPAG